MKKALRIIGGLVLGFIAMGLVGRFFDAHGLPVFHTWGLMHGGFLLVWPGCAVAFYFLFGLIPLPTKANRSPEPRQAKGPNGSS